MAWLTGWSKRKKITLATSALTGNVTADHAILVQQTAADGTFWANTQTNGEDVRFTAADETTELKYYFQRFDHTNDLMDAWVLVTDTFDAGTDIDIYMYYGNGGAADDQDSASTLADFEAVYHCDDNTGTTVDDKVGSFDATAEDSAIWTTSSHIGLAALNCNLLYGMSQGTLLDTVPAQIAFSFWVNFDVTFDSSKPNAHMLRKHNVGASDDYIAILFKNGSGKLYVEYEAGAGVGTLEGTTTSWTLGTWYHVIVGWDTTNGIQIFVNGSRENQAAGATTLMANGSWQNCFICQYSDATGEPDGVVDEVKIYKVEVSQDEALLFYMSEAGTLQSYGAEENAPSTAYMNTKGYW